MPRAQSTVMQDPTASTPEPEMLGAVLVGGLSTRMGTDKATIELGERPLAAWVLDALDAAGVERRVLSGGDRALAATLDAPLVADVTDRIGPLGALRTLVSMAEVVVVVPCDVPFVDPRDLRELVDRARAGDADVVCLHDGRRRQHLVAAWCASSGPAIRAAIEAEQYAIRSVLDELRVVDVSSVNPSELVNLNTPADVEAAQRRLDGHQG